MRICFVVDYRSPIARSWIEVFIASRHEVHIISTHEAVAPDPAPSSLHCVPIGLASLRSRPGLRRHLAMSSGNELATHSLTSAFAGSLLRRISTGVQQGF